MEFDNNIPIYLQIINLLKKDMIQGKLPMGAKLPSAREMALKYQINPNTANRVYKEMEADNLCFTKRGLGTFVTEDKERFSKIREEMADKILEKFIDEMKIMGFEKDELLKIISEKYK